MGITSFKKYSEYFSLVLLTITAVVLIALQLKLAGFILLGIGVLSLLLCAKDFRKNILLIYISLGLLGITPITTDISPGHFLLMGFMLTLALLIPYVISRFVYKDTLIRYQWNHGRWSRTEIFYLFFTFAVTYFLFPFMLRETGSYLNWQVEPGFEYLTILFIGTNALGIWDELFFVNTVLGILRKYLPFAWANLTQAVLFTSFLYELGFRGWAFGVIFFFALLQGYVYKKTESLLYIIAIHLTADLILYLTLLYLHQPTWVPFFIT